ncbi:MAG TPA: TraR/DksA C4-type zinc finger protein [Actinomycetota bacterium]|nr:TraR/DksA C4-type zinc finger protein [Actinomycetota bacterium]
MAKPKPKSAKDLAAVRAKLEKKRDELVTQMADLARAQEAQAEMGETADEFGDSGQATLEREQDLSVVENLRDLLDKVERALDKVADKTYGTCETCGNAVEAARIKALPYATQCIECARRTARFG